MVGLEPGVCLGMSPVQGSGMGCASGIWPRELLGKGLKLGGRAGDAAGHWQGHWVGLKVCAER